MSESTQADDTRTTPEGTEFSITGSRAVFPVPDHEHGGGVALTDEAVTEILAFPGCGSRDDGQLEWEWTGDTEETRVGDSKIIELRQTSFARERTVRVTLVDIADANTKATQ